MFWWAILLLASSGLAGDEPPDLPKPAATKADEPLAKKLSLAKGAEFLDRAAVQWAKAQGCASCHTSYPFLMARPLLGDPKAPALVWMREYLERRVAGWDRGKKGAGLPDEEDEAVTEIVATAATLAFDDARGGKLNPLTRQALDRMWTVQRKDGSWDWNKHKLPPQELDEYYGVVYAALGVGYAPEGYAKSEAAKDGVARLKTYLKENRPPNLHHQTWLLWASLKLDGLMTADETGQDGPEPVAAPAEGRRLEPAVAGRLEAARRHGERCRRPQRRVRDGPGRLRVAPDRDGCREGASQAGRGLAQGQPA